MRSICKLNIKNMASVALMIFVLSSATASEDSSHKMEISFVIDPFENLNAVLLSDNFSARNDSIIQLTNSTEDALFGEAALRVTFDDAVEYTGALYQVGTIVSEGEISYNCIGAEYMSFWYKASLVTGAFSVSLLDGGSCSGGSCENALEMEIFEYKDVLIFPGESNSGWTEIRITLPTWNQGNQGLWKSTSKSNGNGVLDLDHIRGWIITLSEIVVGNVGQPSILFDQLSCVGNGDLLGAAFKSTAPPTTSESVDTWELNVYDSELSENETNAFLKDGFLEIDYMVEQREPWGGFLSFEYNAPMDSYYNLSMADQVSLSYRVLDQATPAGRAHLRLILHDSSACQHNCNTPVNELYYSFQYVLAAELGDGNFTVSLRGNRDQESPFYFPGWSGMLDDGYLDSSQIKGFFFEISMDGTDSIGSTVTGAIALGDFVAEKGSHDDSGGHQCISETGLHMDENLPIFRKIYYENRCCERCDADDDCMYAMSASNGLCLLASHIEPDTITMANTESQLQNKFYTKRKASILGDFCALCECSSHDQTIDCKGQNLTAIPKTFTPSNSTNQWHPRILDMRDNPFLYFIATDSLEEISHSLQELRLPRGVQYLAPSIVSSGLTIVSFEEPPQAADASPLALKNAITDSSGFFGDVCCSLGYHVPLEDPKAGITFCDMQVDRVGEDMVFQPFFNLAAAEPLALISPTSTFMAEAAESPAKCAEYCKISSDCLYFEYDERIANAEHTCSLFVSQGTPTEICCDPQDYADDGMTRPGYTSGRPPRTRHSEDNAKVIFTVIEATADDQNGFVGKYEVSLGSAPFRGAVWISPKVVSNTNLDVQISPSRVALYDDQTTATIVVQIKNAENIISETLVLDNSIVSCDEAFVAFSDATEKNIFLRVVASVPTSSDNRSLAIPLISTLLSAGLCFYLVTAYILVNRRRRAYREKQKETNAERDEIFEVNKLTQIDSTRVFASKMFLLCIIVAAGCVITIWAHKINRNLKHQRELTVSERVAVAYTEIAYNISIQENIRKITTELVDVVFHDSCEQDFTYQLQHDNKVTFIGTGDNHSSKYTDVLTSFPVQLSEASKIARKGVDCTYSLTVYPNGAKSSEAFVYVVPLSFGILLFFFFLFDFFVQRRNRMLVLSAAKTSEIVTTMFPDGIRDKLLNETRTNQKEKKKNKQTQEGNADEVEILAELYPNATICFVEIVGFTAWSSSRQPHQIFKLLETVFGSFDRLAKKGGVYKVETVGDCFIAITGAPIDQADHAERMCRFAGKCMGNFSKLSSRLSVMLGPDTGELSLRVGIHSGCVTMGVLRNDKARYQLFGDSVNMTSQISSACDSGRVHVSRECGDLLLNGGNERWLIPRKNTILSDGTEMRNTYWLELDVLKDLDNFSQYTTDNLGTGTNISDDNDLVTQHERSLNRLIEWNTNTLLDLVKKIIAHRNGDTSSRVTLNASDTFGLANDQTYVDEVAETIVLPARSCDNGDMISTDLRGVTIGADVMAELRDLVRSIAILYNSNPFHNFEHASHVTMSIVKLLSRIVKPTRRDMDAANSLHDRSYGITSDPLTQFACAFCGLLHDANHPGVPNTQLIQEQPELSARFQHRSVAEQNSLKLCFDLLSQDRFENLRRVLFASNEDQERFRKLVVNSVMATDIVDKNMKDLRNGRWAKAFDTSSPSEEAPAMAVNRKATIVIEHLIQASDVSHTMQHWNIYRKWNEKLLQEMFVAYKQGRSSVDPTVNWAKGEIGFFDFYIIPLAKKLKDCGVFGVSSDEYLNYAVMNRRKWEVEGPAITAEMVERLQNLPIPPSVHEIISVSDQEQERRNGSSESSIYA